MPKLLISTVLILWQFIAQAQFVNQAEQELLIQHTQNTLDPKHEVQWVFHKSQNGFIKYNPVSLLAGASLYLYQSTISLQLSADCLYDVSCSRYSFRLLENKDILKGIFLGADRITRCNRLAAQDIHQHQINKLTGKVIDPFIIYDPSNK